MQDIDSSIISSAFPPLRSKTTTSDLHHDLAIVATKHYTGSVYMEEQRFTSDPNVLAPFRMPEDVRPYVNKHNFHWIQGKGQCFTYTVLIFIYCKYLFRARDANVQCGSTTLIIYIYISRKQTVTNSYGETFNTIFLATPSVCKILYHMKVKYNRECMNGRASPQLDQQYGMLSFCSSRKTMYLV